MKYFFLIAILAFCLLVNGISAQDEYLLEGLDKMDSTYVTRFIIGEGYRENLQRIKNIPGVANASVKIDSLSGVVIFDIQEANTLLPILNFGRIKGNYWYKVGLSDINFLGKGQTLNLHYQSNDGRHSGQLYYRNPFLHGSQWGFAVDINRWASLEPLFFPEGRVNYDFTYRNLGVSGIRNFGINRRVEVGLNYFIESYKKADVQDLSQPPGPETLVQPKLLLRSSYSENFVNYNFFLLDGYEWNLAIQNVYNIEDRDFFHIAQFQLKKFISQPRFGNLAMRFRLAFSTNNYSPFAPFVIDSHVNLRGIGNRIDRGTGQFIFNIEYRKTLLKSYPFGIQAVIFSDLGTWRNPGGDLIEMIQADSYRQFVGGGFRIIYQQIFGAVLRIDYGISVIDQSQRGFVLGLGQYF